MWARFCRYRSVLLGAKWAALSQLVYVLLGIIGLPVFTQGGGIGYFLKPSMGFLLGLIPMAYVVGALSQGAYEKKRWYLQIIAAMLAGEAVLYLIGTPYMGAILNVYMGRGLSAAEIARIGCLIYLPGDAVKLALTLSLYRPLMKAL